MNASSLLRLDWNGATITRRATDDYVNLSALVRAHNMATGQNRRFGNWLKSDDAQEFLDALSDDTGISPGVVTPKTLAAQGPAPFGACGKRRLIEVRPGSDTWGHPDVAVELAGWLSKPLRVAINRWFRQEVERQQSQGRQQTTRQGLLPCAVPMAEAIVARRDRNVEVSQAAAELEVPFHELHNARNVGLTGHTAKHWREVSGVRNWIEKADWEHQQLHSVASQAGLNAMKQLNPQVSQADDYVQAMSSAASDLREFAKKYNMPWQPRFMAHRIGTPRAERVLAAAVDEQLPLLA